MIKVIVVDCEEVYLKRVTLFGIPIYQYQFESQKSNKKRIGFNTNNNNTNDEEEL